MIDEALQRLKLEITNTELRMRHLAPEQKVCLVKLGDLCTVVNALSEQTALPDKVPNDTLVDIHEASRILGFSPKWIYRRVKTLPFVRRVGGRLRFSAVGLQKYLTNV